MPSATGVVVADLVRLVRDNAADTDTEARAFAYSYDVLGQPLTVAHPDQRSEYTYDLALDPRGPLTSLSVDDLNDSAGAKVTRYTYDNLGRQATQTKANGNIVTNGYFLDGALKSLREEKSGGALVASHAYTYDNNGNKHTDVASKANADVAGAFLNSTTTYSYDPVDRLWRSVKTGNGAKTETYVHDDNANVISQDVGGTATTYSYDRNRLLTTTADGATASYRYDPFGRQTSVNSAGLTISRTTYDGFDHIAESEKINDAGVLESTTYQYDPLDRTASKTAGGKTTDYTYLGLSSEVLGEEVVGQLTKSYQYSPWGQRLSQITHQADPEQGIEAGESAYYGYNAHTDVETLTDDAGNAVATYGYTAYGNADQSEYTGIDKPEAGTPEDAEPYNAYRYNAKRWDASSGTYDMGFRDYAPGLNRFTTRDMYNGALSDMGLGSDPYTGNRYAFTAGNPISRVEMDGHDWLSETGDWLQEFGTGLVDGVIGAAIGTADWAYRWGSGFGGCLQEDDALCDRAVQAGGEASLSSQWEGLTSEVSGIVDGYGSGESATASASAVLLAGDFASRRPKPNGNAPSGTPGFLGGVAGIQMTLMHFDKPDSRQARAYDYQRSNVGWFEFNVAGGGESIWADGLDGSTLLDAKFVETPSSSPYTGTAPPFVGLGVRDELRRYAAVINDPATMFTDLRIITNTPQSVAYMQGLMTEYGVPGTVELVQ